jgi:hypothetical protein
MQRNYVLVKDHLEQAHAILDYRDNESQQLGQILQMMITLIDDLDASKPPRHTNIIIFPIVPRPIPKL